MDVITFTKIENEEYEGIDQGIDDGHLLNKKLFFRTQIINSGETSTLELYERHKNDLMFLQTFYKNSSIDFHTVNRSIYCLQAVKQDPNIDDIDDLFVYIYNVCIDENGNTMKETRYFDSQIVSINVPFFLRVLICLYCIPNNDDVEDGYDSL